MNLVLDICSTFNTLYHISTSDIESPLWYQLNTSIDVCNPHWKKLDKMNHTQAYVHLFIVAMIYNF